ncbi:MAG: type I pullulanase [Bacteroidota bacterium]
MKWIYTWTLLVLLSFLFACQQPMPTYSSYDDYPVYKGEDLGLVYSPQQSIFKIWSPAASEVKIRLYESGIGGEATAEHQMEKGSAGTWTAQFDEDLEGQFYTFQIQKDGQWMNEVPDPYVKATGVNGKRGMVLDLDATDPPGWENDQRPPLKNFTDIVIYELHVRDLSTHSSSGIQQKGKFLGLTELGTKSPEGLTTGLDHIKELGVSHVHLLPSFDYMSVDESRPEDNQFNWGYDPQNYNVPEGSYSTNPEDGRIRVREFKQMVKTLHDNGLRVIMDVVYNHTGVTEEAHLNQIAPSYYYRQNKEGGFSNASACGNETASDRPMFRKFIIESVKYWAEEYHVDGFRFDLMGIHDIETMNQVSEALHQIDPSIFVYGEGWTAGDSPLPEDQRALKKYTHRIKGVAAFSDDLRDGLKGSVFEHEDTGFATAKPGTKESVKFGIVAATQHPQVDYKAVNYSDAPWAAEPSQCINYVSCHDNHTLYDRLINSVPKASERKRIQHHLLANTIVLTSQGVPFLHAGVEMLRTKGGEENSYKSPDTLNQLVWTRKNQYFDAFQYYKGLVQLRKNHPAFRMPTTAMIQEHLRFLDVPDEMVIGYEIGDHANGDAWKKILVLLNGSTDAKRIDLPKGDWTMVLNERKIKEDGITTISSEKVNIPPSSALVFYQN